MSFLDNLVKLHNLDRLEKLLKKTSRDNRKGLANIIKPDFGERHNPRILCNHLNYLYKGGLVQVMSQIPSGRPTTYKQLVTDVADRVKIDWSSLLHNHNTNYKNLRTRDIETAVARHVALSNINLPDREYHIPQVASDTITNALITFVSTTQPEIAPIIIPGKPVIGLVVNTIAELQATEWKKLLATVIYVHEVIR